MNRLGKNALLLIALLLAAAVAYFSDPVLSDPSRSPETEAPSDVSSNATATSTPPTATTTPVANTPPTVDVMTFRGEPFPDDHIHKINISGSKVSIRLRGQDYDGNLEYLAVVNEYDQEQGRTGCDSTMGSECTLEVTIPTPAEYERAFTYHGIAVDSDGAASEKSIPIEITSILDKSSAASRQSQRPTPRPSSPPRPSESTTVVAGEQVVFEHDSGAKIEIPDGATVLVPPDWSAGPELIAVDQPASDDVVTVSITGFQTPVFNVLDVQSAYDISIVDGSGEDVVLREPVTVTLPFTMPEDKNAADVMAVHWNEPLGRWEEVKGGVVDETEQTVTVVTDELSGFGVTFFVGPIQLWALTVADGVESNTVYSTYAEGFKRALTFHGDVNVPLFYGLGFEGGASLILDIDDILSLGDLTPKHTGEGAGGFFTYGLNGHLAGSFGGAGASGSMQMTKSFTGKRGASRYNNDLSFDASISVLSVSVADGFLETSLLTFNENGNFSPIDAQVSTCPACDRKLHFQAGHGAIIKVLDSTVNIAEGEFNTNFEDILRDLAENRCGQGRCQMSWSDLIGQFMTFMVGGMVNLYSLGEKVGLLYDYTDYEHISPEDAADIGWGYLNQIEGFGGGLDVNGDGVGDLVFPPDQTDGVPLQVLTTGDRSEQKRHFLEVTEITDGWSIEFDAANTPSDLNASSSTPSAGAVARVDFDSPALSLNDIHWLVTSTTTAPDSGHISLRLYNNRTLLEGLTDVQLDEVVRYAIWKDKQHSDLTVEAQVAPDPIHTDESLSYTVVVNNSGPDRADDVKLTMKSIRSLGLSLQRSELSEGSISCRRPDSLGDLVCNLGNIDAGRTATATLEFTIKPTFPTGTPFTTNFAVTQRQGGSPVPREELTPRDNSASVTALTRSDRAALEALYNATDGDNWRNNTNWLSEEPLEDWEGVTTDDRGRVIQLSLVNQGLNGQLPAEMGDLTRLKWLNIARNPNLTGGIPPEMAQLNDLEVLYLWENDLTGSVPTWLGDMVKLRWLSLGQNRLSGGIPDDMRKLTNLDTLYLAGNGLTGVIPDWMGELPALTRLFLYDNDLSGTIPTSLVNLERLEYLYLGGNAFTGCLPTALVNVPENDFDRVLLADCSAPGIRRDPTKEFDFPVSNDDPWAIWSDDTTMWVADLAETKLFGYNLSTGQRDPSKDLDSLRSAGNSWPGDMWSDGTTMWVINEYNPKLFGYNLSTGQWDSSKDFDTLDAAGNNVPTDMWSDGDTMWVADRSTDRLYAYDMGTGQRDSTKDFDTLSAAGNKEPSDIWSDGTTMWVMDLSDDKVYAYDLATRQRDSTEDYETTLRDGSANPSGLWSDGTTMWVADSNVNRVYAYDSTTKQRDAAKDFRVDGNSFPTGIWSDESTVWVAVAGDDDAGILAFDLASRQRDSSKDFNTLSNAGNTRPYGIWSDGTTMWASDRIDGKIYAYSLATKQRDSAKDFDTLNDAGNAVPGGIWATSTTMWVVDVIDDKVYAYDLATKQRDSTKDFDSLIDAENQFPWAIWSDGTTMWVSDSSDGKLYAYDLATREREPTGDFDPLFTYNQNALQDTTSNGTTTWALDRRDNQLYAYDLSTRQRDMDKDVNLLSTETTVAPHGIWSDEATIWVADGFFKKLHAYDLTTGDRAPDKDFDTLIGAGNEAPGGIWSDGTTMWVADSEDNKIYAYNLATKARDSDKDFDTLVDAGHIFPTGIWSDGTTMWVVNRTAKMLYAYNLATKQRHSANDLSIAANRAANGIWSDGTTMWVTDFPGNIGTRIYAYDFATRQRHPTKDLDSILYVASNTALWGIWSDGTTMWVGDWFHDKLFAYELGE